MPIFPALNPTGRTFTPGDYPNTTHPLMTGREIRVRHSSTVVGNKLSLAFSLLTRTEMLSIQSHYDGQLGGFYAFTLPSELTLGIAAPADISPTGHQWVYAGPPQITDQPVDGASPSNVYGITIDLVSVPPENLVVAGLRSRARASWAAGFAKGPFNVLILWAPGVALYYDPDFYAVASLAAGAAFASAPGASLTVTTAWPDGTVPGSVPGFALTVTAYWPEYTPPSGLFLWPPGVFLESVALFP